MSDVQEFFDDVYFHLSNYFREDDATYCSSELLQAEKIKCPFDVRLNIHSSVLPMFKRSVAFNKDWKSGERSSSVRPKKVSNTKRKLNCLSPEKEHSESKSSIKKLCSDKKKLTRTSWRIEDDKFLIQCLITQTLIEKITRKPFCISQQLMFEIFVSYRGFKHVDKDDDLFLRRLRSLKKKELTLKLIRCCLPELVYIQMPINFDEDMKSEENKKTIFSTVLERVMKHDFVNTEYFLTNNFFKQRSGNNIEESEEHKQLDQLSFEQFIKNYKVCEPYEDTKLAYFDSDPVNYYDIHAYVISNVVLSSLISLKRNLISNKSGQSSTNPDLPNRKHVYRILCKLLKNFSDTFINLVIKRMTMYELITHNKNFTTDKFYAYKLSIKYSQQLFNSNIQFNKVDSTLNLDQGTIKDTNTALSSVLFVECFTSHLLDGVKLDETCENVVSVNSPFKFNMEVPNNVIFSTNASNGTASRNSILKDNLSTLFGIDFFPDNNSERPIKKCEDFKINHCKVHIETHFPKEFNSFPPEVSNLLRTYSQVYTDEEIDSPLNDSSYDDVLQKYLQHHTNGETFIENINLKTVILYVSKRKELGVKQSDITDYILSLCQEIGTSLFQHDHLFNMEKEANDFLTYLQSVRILFSVGIVEKTWVHRDHIRHWLVQLSYPTFNGKQSSFYYVPKLWIKSDGSIDTELLFVFFNLILIFINCKQVRVTQSILLDKMKCMIPPVQVLELLDLLHSIDCIRVSREQKSNFDTYQPQNLEQFFMDPNDLMEKLEDSPDDNSSQTQIVYEMTNTAYTRLALFYQNLHKR